MRLYRVTVTDVELTVADPDYQEEEGRYQVAYRQFFRRFDNLPLKVVYVLEEEPVIVTVYPLRKTYRR
jgi:hypothetical protein